MRKLDLVQMLAEVGVVCCRLYVGICVYGYILHVRMSVCASAHNPTHPLKKYHFQTPRPPAGASSGPSILSAPPPRPLSSMTLAELKEAGA